LVRFIHTADWQVGMRAVQVGSAAETVRRERLEAVRRILEVARKRCADFLLVAGDVFEDNRVDRVLVQRLLDLLSRSPCPVYLLPGNHDPLVPGAVWDHRGFASPGNVTVLRRAAPVAAPGCVLYPCPVASKESNQDPTGWIPREGAGLPRIGVAHGSVEGPNVSPWDHPIPRDAAERCGLDYLALGHWHSTGTFQDRTGAVRMAYSGTPEPTSFGERDSGNVLLVEVEAGSPPSIQVIPTGRLEWVRMEETLLGPKSLEGLKGRLEALPEPGSTLIHLTLRGHMSPQCLDDLEAIRQVLEARFLWHRIHEDPWEVDRSWIQLLPEGMLREVALRLLDRGEDPAVRDRAVFEMYRILKEVRG